MKSTTLLFYSAIVLILSLTVSAWAHSPAGLAVNADAWLLVGTGLFSASLWAVMLIVYWRRWRNPVRILGLATAVLAGSVLALSIYSTWPRLPWGRAGALQVADEFMQQLSAGQYQTAADSLSPLAQKHIGLDPLERLSARPTQWRLTAIDRDSSVTGRAAFADGLDRPVEILMSWRNGRWNIDGATFGERTQDADGNWHNTTILDFMVCCDADWFHGIGELLRGP